VLWYLQQIITAPTLVVLSRRLGAGDVDGARRAYELAVRMSYLTGLAVSILVVILADPITALLGGEDYLHSATALTICGSVIWLSYVSFVQGMLIMAGDHVRAGLVTAGIFTTLTLGADVALILPFGTRGAAAAAAFGVAATLAGCTILHRRTLGWSTPSPPVRLLAVAAVALAVGWSLRGVPVAAGAATLATYGLGLAGTGVLPVEEAKKLVGALRSPRSA
jgi:O-antigen/teichoic acid export membrane protein